MGFEFNRDIMGGESRNEKRAKEQKKEKEYAQAYSDFSSSVKDDPRYAGMSFSGDLGIAQGQKSGLDKASTLYGMSPEEIGTEVQDIVARRKQAIEGQDPATDALRRSKAQQIRSARSEGATRAQQAQIERMAMNDIGQQEFKSQQQAMGEYQSLIGNILGGTSQMEYGSAMLNKAGETADAPENRGVTVICTELYRQGYMSADMLSKDAEYGRHVRDNDINVYIGYIWLASPIVSLMRKSPLFTKLISYPALEWAKDMAYDNSITGKIINTVGQFVCRPVGWTICKLHRVEA